jgi:hypothetical protein
MSTKFLKVKIKSLAAEARIIRHEERKSRGQLRNDLANHRKGIVRREARNTQLAYGYLRGRSYRQLEHSCHRQPDWEAVERMVKRYGRLNQPLKEWANEQEERQSMRGAAA